MHTHHDLPLLRRRDNAGLQSLARPGEASYAPHRQLSARECQALAPAPLAHLVTNCSSPCSRRACTGTTSTPTPPPVRRSRRAQSGRSSSFQRRTAATHPRHTAPTTRARERRGEGSTSARGGGWGYLGRAQEASYSVRGPSPPEALSVLSSVPSSGAIGARLGPPAP